MCYLFGALALRVSAEGMPRSVKESLAAVQLAVLDRVGDGKLLPAVLIELRKGIGGARRRPQVTSDEPEAPS
jgi:hypothetical protein